MKDEPCRETTEPNMLGKHMSFLNVIFNMQPHTTLAISENGLCLRMVIC